MALEQALKLVVKLNEQGSRAKWISPVKGAPSTAATEVPIGEEDSVEAEVEAAAEVETETQPQEGKVDLSFATELWQKTIRVRRLRKRKYVLDRKLLELCVLSYLAFELRTGDMYVEGSQEFADYRTQLLSWQECEDQVASYCATLELPDTAEKLVAQLKSWLNSQAKTVDEALPNNPGLRVDEQGRIILSKTSATPTSSNYIALSAALHQRLEQKPKSLLQILANSEHWCNWTRHFETVSGSDTKMDRALEKYLLTVFAYGVLLGPVQTAAHLNSGINEQHLSFIHRAHITTSRLEAAKAEIINAYSRFALPQVWGNPKIAAADGTKIDLPDNSLFSRYHFRFIYRLDNFWRRSAGKCV